MSSNISIAIIRKPAAIPPTYPHYAGALFINPGSSGYSSIRFIFSAATELQTVLNSPDAQYDIIDVSAWNS